MLTVRILAAASRELTHLDKQIARRIVKRLRWLAGNPEKVKHKALKGELAGLFSLREGDYRVIYEIVRGEQTMLIHAIAHRRDVYKRR